MPAEYDGCVSGDFDPAGRVQQKTVAFATAGASPINDDIGRALSVGSLRAVLEPEDSSSAAGAGAFPKWRAEASRSAALRASGPGCRAGQSAPPGAIPVGRALGWEQAPVVLPRNKEDRLAADHASLPRDGAGKAAGAQAAYREHGLPPFGTGVALGGAPLRGGSGHGAPQPSQTRSEANRALPQYWQSDRGGAGGGPGAGYRGLRPL